MRTRDAGLEAAPDGNERPPPGVAYPASGRGRPYRAQLLIEDNDPCSGSAKGHGPLLEGIVARGARRMCAVVLEWTVSDRQTGQAWPSVSGQLPGQPCGEARDMGRPPRHGGGVRWQDNRVARSERQAGERTLARPCGVTLLPLPAWHTLGPKMHPFCSSSRTILPRRCVVTREHHGYASEVIEHGEKNSTQDNTTRGQDLSGGGGVPNELTYC